MMKRFTVAFAVICLLSSFSALATVDTDVSAIKSDVSNIKTNIGYIYTKVGSIESDVDTLRSYVTTYLPDISSNITSIKSNVSLMYSLLSGISTRLAGFDGTFTAWSNRFNNLDTNVSTIKSDVSTSKGHLSDILDSIIALERFFVNSHHTALENATNDATDQATSMVQQSPGGTTQAQKNSAISGFSSSMASGLDTGVSSDSVWSLLTDGDPGEEYRAMLPVGRSGNIFAFFSNETLYDLDPSLATRASQPEVVDYLSLNQRSFSVLKSEGSDQR